MSLVLFTLLAFVRTLHQLSCCVSHLPLQLDITWPYALECKISCTNLQLKLYHHQRKRMGKGMEKLTYVHILKLGESEEGPIPSESSFTGSTNDWYLIKQVKGGDGVELTRVFEDASLPNHQGPALWGTNCQVIGSCIYVIGGIGYGSGFPYYIGNLGSGSIHFLDTCKPKDGWRTCYTLPFVIGACQSAVVDDQWLYILTGAPCDEGPQDSWGYAVNVKDNKQTRKITPPSNSLGCPVFATCLSPGTLVVCMCGESTWYQLDCENGTWTVCLEESPYPSSWLRCCTVVDDGILYIYDNFDMRLISYDIRNKKELYVVDVPRSFWFARGVHVKFIVLSKNRFCITWPSRGTADNELSIVYTRFSVSCLPEPTVDIEEKRIFPAVGYIILNAVAVGPHSDEAHGCISNSNAAAHE